MNEPMRVAMIIQSYHPIVGGAERQLAALIPLLRARCVEAIVLTRRYAGLSAFERINEATVYRLPAIGPKVIASLVFTLTALWTLRRLRPQVIHAFDMLSPATTAVIANRLFGIPVVVKVLRGGVLGDMARLTSRPTGMSRLALLRKHVAAFVTITHEIDAELAQAGISARQRVFIPNGVDLKRFYRLSHVRKQALRAKLGFPDAPIVIYAGRLTPEKRVDSLLTIWPAVAARNPNAQLLILGNGVERARLEGMASSGVRFTGNVSDVAPYLQVADLFVLPSETEGLSNALLEAMACGLPVVVTAVGGACDVIEHGVSGWLVGRNGISPNEGRNGISPHTELQEAVLTLLDNPVLRFNMGTQARKQVKRDYALSSVADRLSDLYSGCLCAT